MLTTLVFLPIFGAIILLFIVRLSSAPLIIKGEVNEPIKGENNGSNGTNIHKLEGGYDLYVRQIALL
jgi:hypothetical protein